MSNKPSLEIVEKHFKPNENGVSEWVTRETLKKIREYNFIGGNGITRKGVPVWAGCKKYKWDFIRNTRGTIISFKMIGLNTTNNKNTRGINSKIKKEMLKNQKTCIRCGDDKNLCIDHKNDLYNNPRVLNINTQKESDFQVLCQKCNKDCKHHKALRYEEKNNKIYSVKNLNMFPFKSDNFEYPWEKHYYDTKNINIKEDCSYWGDIEEFNRKRDLYMMYTIPIIKSIKSLNINLI